MSPGDAVLVGVGLTTAVGLSSAETAASVRATTMRFRESALHDKGFQPFTLAELPESALPPLAPTVVATGFTSRMMRMLRLAGAPLLESIAALPAHAPRPGLLLSLPETETAIPLDGSSFLGGLLAQCEGRFDDRYATAEYRGRAGGLAAIGQAVQLLRTGRVPLLIVGGVDTFRDLYVLGTLDREERVKSATSLDGFVPGEGAAFLLMASGEACRRFGLTPIAILSEVKEGHESGHLYSNSPYRGDGLASTLRQVGDAGLLPQQAAEVWGTMNGESHWGKEWGVAFMRNRQMFAEDHGMQHPADCYGDIGAASGPALVALAAMGARGGYRRTPALVYASSDRGARAALVVRSPDNE